jgi:PAS domain S-box-containing protein
MRRALSGLSGAITGPDYRGVTVLAAHEPVNAYGLGIVAKIDLAEVRSPFVQAGLVSLGVALLVVVLGVVLFSRITNPVIDELRRSEARFHGLYSSMSEGVAMLQMVHDSTGKPTDYRLLAGNPAFERLTGLTLAQAAGHLASELHPGGSPPNREEFAQVSKAGEPAEFETEEMLGGRAFHVSAFSPGSGIVAAVFADITERKRAEQALRENEEKFRTLAQATPDHVMLLDAGLRIGYANFAAPGLTVEQLIGTSLPDFAPPGREAEIRTLLQGVIETGAETAYETTYEPPVGATIHFESRAARLGEDTIVVVARDVTGRKRAEERLRATMDELERSNADLEQFAYVASHDLQEPLRMIASYVGLLSERYRGRLDERADRYIDYAVDGARRMQALIEGLLHYSRVGTKGGVATELDLASVVAEARTNIGRRVEEAGAVVDVEPLPHVTGDRVQFLQVFQNLLDNAVKFRSAAPPTVSISCRDAGDQWEVAVRDNGIGIDPKYAERIFGVFKRLHTEQEYPGTGIGLALCRKIVERHGGRIWMEPAEGGGSVFRFTLPKQPVAGFEVPAGTQDKEA